MWIDDDGDDSYDDKMMLNMILTVLFQMSKSDENLWGSFVLFHFLVTIANALNTGDDHHDC